MFAEKKAQIKFESDENGDEKTTNKKFTGYLRAERACALGEVCPVCKGSAGSLADDEFERARGEDKCQQVDTPGRVAFCLAILHASHRCQ